MTTLNDSSAGKRVVGYCRFSSNNQREESIDAQKRAITEHCKRMGWVIVGWYEDKALSGTSDQRPSFLRMVADSEQGIFDIVLVHKLDRFSRNVLDKELYKMELAKNGVELKSVTEHWDDSPEGTFNEGIVSLMAEFYSRNLSREIKKGMRENAYQGKFSGGRCLYGYAIDPVTRKYIINEDEASGVRLMFQMAKDGFSYKEIAEELNRRGYQTRTGNPFGINSLHDMLTNEKYTGTLIYQKYVSEGTFSKNARRPHKLNSPDKQIVNEGVIPAIIDKEEFDRVQERFQGRRRRAAGKAKEVYLLSGKIVCGECGAAYAGNRHSPHKGYDKPCVNYRCTRHNKTVTCSNPSVNRDLLEQEVLKLLGGIIYDEESISAVIAAYRDFQSKQGNDEGKMIERLSDQLTATENKLVNLAHGIAVSGALPPLLAELEKVNAEKERMTAELQRLKSQVKENEIDEETLRETFYAAKQAFTSGEAPEVKRIVQRFVEKVVVFPDGVEVCLNLGNERLSQLLQKREAQEKTTRNKPASGGLSVYPLCGDTMVRLKGFEPPTYWFVASHSIQLSYSRIHCPTDSLIMLAHSTGKCKKFLQSFLPGT